MDIVEVSRSNGITITVRRPPSALAEHAAAIREALGRDLPSDLAAFYADGDGLRYEATGPDGETIGDEAEIYCLQEAFAGFRAHRPLPSIEAFGEDDEMCDQPFYEELWSEEFPLDSEEDLDRLNTLRRSKVLVSIPGESAWLTIDLLDPDAPYRIGLAQDGCDLHPLDLSFPDFVANFRRFGAARWYLAFAGRAAEEAMNIDFASTLATSLAPFAKAWPDEVAALVARVEGR